MSEALTLNSGVKQVKNRLVCIPTYQPVCLAADLSAFGGEDTVSAEVERHRLLLRFLTLLCDHDACRVDKSEVANGDVHPPHAIGSLHESRKPRSECQVMRDAFGNERLELTTFGIRVIKLRTVGRSTDAHSPGLHRCQGDACAIQRAEQRLLKFCIRRCLLLLRTAREGIENEKGF